MKTLLLLGLFGAVQAFGAQCPLFTMEKTSEFQYVERGATITMKGNFVVLSPNGHHAGDTLVYSAQPTEEGLLSLELMLEFSDSEFAGFLYGRPYFQNFEATSSLDEVFFNTYSCTQTPYGRSCSGGPKTHQCD